MIKPKYKDYLPTPLRTLTPLTERRQLVLDIEASGKYVDDLPILESYPEFLQGWQLLIDNMNRSLPLSLAVASAEFQNGWHLFHPLVSAIDFDQRIPKVSRDAVRAWPDISLGLNSLRVSHAIIFSYEELQAIAYLDRVLNPNTNNVWEDLLDSMETVFAPIDNSITKLSGLRNIDASYNVETLEVEELDKDTVNLTARLVGLNLRTEILDALGKEKVAQLIPMVGQFYRVRGTDDFITLIELVLSSKVILQHLYSRDYTNFKTYDEMMSSPPSTANDNFWFKTTHINLYVEYNEVKHLATSLKAGLGQSVLDIVESFIPLHAVLNRVGFTVELNKEDAPSLNLGASIGTDRALGHTISTAFDPFWVRR